VFTALHTSIALKKEHVAVKIFMANAITSTPLEFAEPGLAALVRYAEEPIFMGIVTTLRLK
jgi:hypothetical protein